MKCHERLKYGVCMARSPRIVLGVLLPIFVVPLWACESSRYAGASETDTIDAYRRYLTRHPEGDKAPRARQRVEVLVYKDARKADRPMGYSLYLRSYPGGRYALACRERLAQLALKRARTPAQLQLILERYPGTPEATVVARRLPAALAAAALASADTATCRRFLDRYPDAPDRPRVRALLARLLFRSLGTDRLELESFAQEFAGTPEAGRALAKLRQQLIAEVQQTRDAGLLRELAARFPADPQLQRLRGLVTRHKITEALARVDLAALAELAQGGDEARQAATLVKWCAPRKQRCQKIQHAGRKAHVWQPAASLTSLQARVFSPELLVSWHAITTLGWMRSWSAGDQLLELCGSSRLSMVWIAEQALARWISRQRGSARQRWIDRLLRRSYRKANPDEVQRRGVLLMLVARHQQGIRLLRRLATGRSDRQLTASYLQIRQQRRQNLTVPRPLLSRFVRAVDNRLSALEDGFPARVTDHSLVAAILAERELYALQRAVEAARALDQLSNQRGKIAVTLSRVRLALTRASKTFQPAREIQLRAVQQHHKGRAVALRQLLAARDPLSKAVGQAICELEPLPLCNKGEGKARPRKR